MYEMILYLIQYGSLMYTFFSLKEFKYGCMHLNMLLYDERIQTFMWS